MARTGQVPTRDRDGPRGLFSGHKPTAWVLDGSRVGGPDRPRVSGSPPGPRLRAALASWDKRPPRRRPHRTGHTAAASRPGTRGGRSQRRRRREEGDDSLRAGGSLRYRRQVVRCWRPGPWQRPGSEIGVHHLGGAGPSQQANSALDYLRLCHVAVLLRPLPALSNRPAAQFLRTRAPANFRPREAHPGP